MHLAFQSDAAIKVRKTEALPPESARRNCDETRDGDHPPTGPLVTANSRTVLRSAIPYRRNALGQEGNCGFNTFHGRELA
jgi:hypothetical protein